jgi:hypothetical protein
MKLRIIEIHPAKEPELLNSEWFVLENGGGQPFNTRNCVLRVQGKGIRRSDVGTLDPGFILAPGEQVRVVTGNPGRKGHGEVPADALRNYHLFLASPVVRGAGTVLTLTLRSMELTSGSFDPAAPRGVAPPP